MEILNILNFQVSDGSFSAHKFADKVLIGGVRGQVVPKLIYPMDRTMSTWDAMVYSWLLGWLYKHNCRYIYAPEKAFLIGEERFLGSSENLELHFPELQ